MSSRPSPAKLLAELFHGRSQLVVDHFMLGPGWQAGCVGCSFGADHRQVSSSPYRRKPVSMLELGPGLRRDMRWGMFRN